MMKVGAVKKSAVSPKWVSMLCLSLSVTCLYVEYSSSEKTGLTREREREGVCEEGEGECVCVCACGRGGATNIMGRCARGGQMSAKGWVSASKKGWD